MCTRAPLRPFGFVFLALAVWLGGVAVARAEPEAPAPSLSLASDPAPPHAAWVLAVDPLAVAFGHYGVQVEAAPTPLHSVWVAPAWVRGAGPGLELGYHVWPLARGLHGPFLGPTVGVVLAARSAVERMTVGGEAGYQHAWPAVVLGAAIGVQARWDGFGAQGGGARAEARVRVTLGYAWR